MLTRIGRPAAGGDAVDLLVECHGRIRQFIALARRLGEASSLDGAEVAEAAARVHLYFTKALPLHARDEEESIAPRLAGRDPELDRELAAMRREHAEHRGPLDRLTDSCLALVAVPGRHTPLAGSIAEAADELGRHFAVHLEREERSIFPAARRLLDPAEDLAVVAEIRARRR